MNGESDVQPRVEPNEYKEPPIPKRALAIHAHPDDQEFSVAGTLAKWARAGCEIISVVITNGDAGSNDPKYDESYKPALARLREEEQEAANRIIGVHETVFLHYHDGVLQPTLELRRDLTRIIRKYRPDTVLCGDPQARFYGNSYMNHPDHRAAADAACDAVFPSAGTRLIFTELLHEGYEPHDVNYLYLHGSEKPDVWIDITSTIDTKILALQQHKSQLNGNNIGKMIRDWASEDGKEKGMQFAESFLRMVLVEEKET
jgi:LmbE family N-acetylglucosaminyl deacetylase